MKGAHIIWVDVARGERRSLLERLEAATKKRPPSACVTNPSAAQPSHSFVRLGVKP